MSEPPFPNEYTLRRVAESDAKACVICYKPTATVLLAANKADFFYICASHLQDASFAQPVHPASYTELVAQRKLLEGKYAAAHAAAEAKRPYLWNKLMSKWGWTEEKAKATEKEAKDKDAKDAKGDTYEELARAAAALKQELDGVAAAVDAFVFKTHNLNKDMYKMRLNSHLQAQARARRQAAMREPLFFPAAPTGAPGPP